MWAWQRVPVVDTTERVLRACGFLLRVGLEVVLRPRLWATALAQACRFAPDRWWLRYPFLPCPASRLMAFRVETMYGDSELLPQPCDVVTWLEWCKSQSCRR